MVFRDNSRNQDYNKGATFNGKIVIIEKEGYNIITDSWDEIANNIRNGKAGIYPVGSLKEVEIDGNSYTVRLSNNSTPDECAGDDFSQTACGAVFEFIDIIEERPMNNIGTNEGGWPATEMRTYANGEFFNKLPNDLQNIIIDTKVISGYRYGETSQYESTDKIYLLNAHEIYKDSGADWRLPLVRFDNASNTRQLDYYNFKGVKTNNNANTSYAIKKTLDNGELSWWLRSSYYVSGGVIEDEYATKFIIVEGAYDSDNYLSNGSWNAEYAGMYLGFAPAFRIG